MAFVCPSSKRVATEHSDKGSQMAIGRAAPSSADCTEPVVSIAALATEQRSMPQECDAQSGEEPTDRAIVESPLSERFNQMVNDSAVAQRVVVMLQKLGIPDLVSIAAMSDDQWSAVLAFLPVKRPGRAEDLDDPGRLGPGHGGALGRLRRVACEEHPEVAPAHHSQP